jgi:hypothetical protein
MNETSMKNNSKEDRERTKGATFLDRLAEGSYIYEKRIFTQTKKRPSRFI